MRQHNLRPIIHEFRWGSMQVIALGSHMGRVYVPMHCRFDPEATDYDLAPTVSGRKKIVRRYKCPAPKGWLARISSYGRVGFRQSVGNVLLVAEDESRVTVVARGTGHYRASSWDDVLVAISPPFPVRFYVIPAGSEGSEGRGPWWLVFHEDRVDRVETLVREYEAATGVKLEGSAFVRPWQLVEGNSNERPDRRTKKTECSHGREHRTFREVRSVRAQAQRP